MSPAADYIRIARPDYWIKNLFVLPGVPLALFFFPELANSSMWGLVLLGLVATCVVASSNYVINELLDAHFDRFHPVKKDRPLAAGRISRPLAWLLWIVLSVAGIALGFLTSVHTGYACLVLWASSLVYNVPPVRTKELPYLDVLSEASNNPMRLAIGWYATGVVVMPPLSALFAYWMFGAFLMATKRFAEYRSFESPAVAAQYRRSFHFYNEERLVVSIVFYIALFIAGASVFIMHYQHELLLGLPFVSYLIAYYLYLGFQPDSPVQYPERLYKERTLMTALVLTTAFCLVLFFVDFPVIANWFDPLLLPQ